MTNLPPAIKKESPNGHKRTVSWGALTTQNLQQPDFSLPGASNNDNNKGGSGRITQEDLAARMPTESEGESFIVNSLENLDPTIGRRSEKSVLSNITDMDLHALHSNDSASVGSAKSSGRRTLHQTWYQTVAVLSL